MTLEYRIDDGGTLAAPRRTPQGFLRVDAHPARCGILEYADANAPGGVRRELRLPEDVFAPESLASYADASVTSDHPPEMVSPENARAVEVGNVAGAARKDGERVAAGLVIKDARAIARVEAGTRELSVGYRVRVEPKSGTHPLYGRYDAIQRDIVVNHVAIVDAGRAGSACSIRMDANAVCLFGGPRYHSGATMADKPKNADPTELAAAASLLAEQTLRADKAEALAATEKSRADAAEGRADTLEAEVKTLREQRVDSSILATKDAEIATEKARADKAEALLAGFDERVAAAVKSRNDIERSARLVLGLEHKFDHTDDKDLMIEVVSKLQTAPIPAGSSVDYVRARFDAAVDAYVKNGDAYARITVAAEAQRRADAEVAAPRNSAEARAEMIRRNREAASKPYNPAAR